MTRNKIGRIDQIRRTYGIIAKTQMRASKTSRFFGIVCKISLNIFIGILSNNFNRILVCPYCTIRSDSIKFSLINGFVHRNFFFYGKRFKCHIIYNSDGKIVLWNFHRQILKHRKNLSRCGIFRRKSINTPNNFGSIFFPIETILYIHIKWLTQRSRLFCTIEHGDSFCRLGNSGKESFSFERTI